MRIFSILAASLLGTCAWGASATPLPTGFPVDYNPYDLRYSRPLDELPTEGLTKITPRNMSKALRAIPRHSASSQEYFVGAQTYFENNSFCFDGGEAKAYDLEITIDGEDVTISGLFNLAALTTSLGVDYPVTGKYDEENHTISIPAFQDYDQATICGTLADYYEEVLVAGTLNENAVLKVEDYLVLNVVGDFEYITTDMDFGLMNYANAGMEKYGCSTLYRRFHCSLKSSEPNLIVFTDNINFGETFAGYKDTKHLSMVNMSTAEMNYEIEFTSGAENFSTPASSFTIPALSINQVPVVICAANPGDVEGKLEVRFTGKDGQECTHATTLAAHVNEAPDFSDVALTDNLFFTTSLQCPFEIATLDDGTVVAQSTTKGAYGSSELTVSFDIPEGEIGSFSWLGMSVSETMYWYNSASIYVDQAATPLFSCSQTADISNTLDFGPGAHSVTFRYDTYRFTGDSQNRLYVHGLSLELNPAVADAAMLVSDHLNMGKLLIRDASGVKASGEILVQNRGINPLSVIYAEADNDAISVSLPDETAALMETLVIPVEIEVAEACQIESNVTIETSAGILNCTVSALVREMADLTKIVTEGAECVTGFDTDNSNPFTLDGDVAYNANSGMPDNEGQQMSWFTINFTIPSGKIGILSWDGLLDGQVNKENAWDAEVAFIQIIHPYGSVQSFQKNGYEDLGSVAMFEMDDAWKKLLTSTPGNNSITFIYGKNGDGKISERDRLEISNLKIHLEDYPDYGVSADTESIEFEPTYVGGGRYTSAFINLTNTGSMPLEVSEIQCDHPFYATLLYGYIQYGESRSIEIQFRPTDEGEFSGDIVLKTNAGDVVVKCHAKTNMWEGVLLNGDVEDEGQGWMSYDADGDGVNWTLGKYLWGQGSCHSGQNCFGSPSADWMGNPQEPDNWLISPEVTIPEEGAFLQWYAGALDWKKSAEYFSVYVFTPEDFDNITEIDLDEWDPIWSDELPENVGEDKWYDDFCDLKDFGGQTVRIVFRHHACEQYVLRLDDIFVFTNERWDNMVGADRVISDSKAVSTEIFNVNGMRRNALGNGINIVRVTYADGSVKSYKIMVNN